MTTDLYLTKTDILLDWARHVQIFSSADIERHGQSIGVLAGTARRIMRRKTGKNKTIQKISKERCITRGLNENMAWFEYNPVIGMCDA